MHTGSSGFTAKQSGTATIIVRAGDCQTECIVTVEGKGTAVSNKDGSVTTTVTEKTETEDGITEVTKITDKKDGKVTKTTDIITVSDEKAGITTEFKQITDIDGKKESSVVSTIGKSDVNADDIKKAVSQAESLSEGITGCKPIVKIEDSGNGSISIGKGVADIICDADLEISFDDVSVILNKDVLDNMSDGQIDVSSAIPKGKPSVLGVSLLSVREFNMSVDDADIHELGGKMTLTIDCEIPDGYSQDDIRAWYVDDNGILTPVPCVWKDGKVFIEVTHLSTYAVGVGDTEYSVGKTAAFLTAVVIGMIGIVFCLTYPFIRKD